MCVICEEEALPPEGGCCSQVLKHTSLSLSCDDDDDEDEDNDDGANSPVCDGVWAPDRKPGGLPSR